ncbi:EthD domain-containing protein [Paractinoplanes atraurantiacus]|uniref:EthD domain-containing protein n=1 Tax=Paractinoplanes atraurantiacus TaxID=1036182 RepID=A0A285J604_9ACTN|nr:EthD domain-containing protein [Actinoplanes atraurantiacus]SNY55642.1 EthD domain-containing protein [Actinoplanes atraurantiacus]
MAFLVKKPEIGFAELVDYYENHHVPLILSLAPAPLGYQRNFVDGAGDFHVVTELVFADRGAYEKWVSAMYAPGSGVAEDEARFLDRARTRSYVVDERVTSRPGH